jgi:predicted dehydrogenase
MPDPILIGRNADKIEALAQANGIGRFGTDLDKALANKEDTVFFDAGTTQMRPTLLAKAIHAGKHVYCEKPIATNLNEAVEIARLAEKSGVKHGAVQDKLFLPGLRKLDMLRKAGFFGKSSCGINGQGTKIFSVLIYNNNWRKPNLAVSSIKLIAVVVFH